MPSPGLPGGLMTLGQYLSANQPAIDRTQAALQQYALNPYQQALQGAKNQAVTAGQAAEAPGTPGTPATATLPVGFAGPVDHAPGAPYAAALAGGRTVPIGHVNPHPEQVATLKNSPIAQANLNDAQSSLADIGQQASQSTATAGGRANDLTNIFGTGTGLAPGMATGGSPSYTPGDAGLDAALTTQVAAPNVGNDVRAAEGGGPRAPGTPLAPRGGGPTGAAPGPAAPPGPNFYENALKQRRGQP